ncbi:hypothetical protein BGY98DRAFT_522497 [Russula aff. rugulosa BPL654]|nr:hypothetical protein BGY98DRAFT_522497 [Russula aff. rugulosa BPL654]
MPTDFSTALECSVSVTFNWQLYGSLYGATGLLLYYMALMKRRLSKDIEPTTFCLFTSLAHVDSAYGHRQKPRSSLRKLLHDNQCHTKSHSSIYILGRSPKRKVRIRQFFPFMCHMTPGDCVTGVFYPACPCLLEGKCVGTDPNVGLTSAYIISHFVPHRHWL